MDKLARFTLLPQDDEPILWDFGSAARHHQIYCPWLGDRSRATPPAVVAVAKTLCGRV